MDERVLQFVRDVAYTMVGLDVALFYQANPSTFDTPSGIALRTHRGVNEIRPALERLAEHGILEVHERAEGRYICYALVRNTTVWTTLCRVSEAYHGNPEARKQILMILVQQQRDAKKAQQQAEQSASAGSEQDNA